MKELLRALADSDREREAPPEVEVRLRAAFRKKHRRRTWPYFAVAVAMAAGVVLAIRGSKPPVQRPPAEIAVVKQRVAVPLAAAIPVVAHRKPRPPQEVVTEFYALMEDPMPFEGGELVRVSVPAAAMRSVGVAVSEDRLTEMVQADVLVGQEGLARAIRFVNTSVNRP